MVLRVLFKLLSYCSYCLWMLLGLVGEMLFDTSKSYLINEDARRKLTDNFKNVIKKERLKGNYQIAYQTQTSPFTLWQIQKGAITVHMLRGLGIFYEHYQDGEELIGSFSRLGVLPLPSAIIINRKLDPAPARNTDCGFVIGWYRSKVFTW